ncbi:hypothetical protein RVM27_10230 [Halomonas sp. KM007]
MTGRNEYQKTLGLLHQLMPNSQLCVMPTKGHCIHMTHPDAVVEQVIRWLNKAA